MKTKFTALLLAVAITFSFLNINVGALTLKDYGVKVDANDGFTAITYETAAKNEQFLNKMKFTVKTFKEYLTSNNIILFAADETLEKQFTVICYSTEFSMKTGDLTYLSDTNIVGVSEGIFGEYVFEYDIEEYNGSKYIKRESVKNDKVGTYISIQYVTIKNGNIYTVTYNSSGETLTDTERDTAQKFIRSLTISDAKERKSIADAQETITFVILGMAILFVIMVAVYIAYTFITDFIRKRSSNDVSPYVRIKRRKF